MFMALLASLFFDLMFTLLVFSGESNAGIYIPTLIFVIEEMNKKVAPENVINLKGFVVTIFHVNLQKYKATVYIDR